MKRLLDPKFLPLLFALLLVAVAVWRWSDDNVLSPQAQNAQDTNTPDAFVVNGRYRMFREDGQLSSILTSKRAVHYPEDNTGHLQDPEIEMFQRDGRPWHIESEEGFLNMDSDVVVLRKDVVVQSLDQEQRPVTMTTDELTINNHTRFITTDRPVKISAQHAETTAVGMDAYVDEKRMLLKSQVRGNYVPVSQ